MQEASPATDTEVRRLRALGLEPPPGFRLLPEPFGASTGAGCGVVPTLWHERPARGADPDAVREDLPILQTVLRESYAGYDQARARGWDWDRFFADWVADLAAGGAARASPWKPWLLLQHTHPDRHTGPALGEPTPPPSTVLVEGSDLEGPVAALRDAAGLESSVAAGDHRCRLHSAFWIDPRSPGRPTPVALLRATCETGRVVAVRIGSVWWPTRLLPEDRDPGAASAASRALAPDVGYLRLPTPDPFSSLDLPRPDLASRILVVDLRGNRGGAGGIWLELVAAWFGDSFLEPVRRMGRFETWAPLTPALRWGAAQALLATAKTRLPEPLLGQAQGLLDGLAEPPARRRHWRHAGSFRLRAPGAPGCAEGRPRLVVLVDDACGSDGELIALLLAAQPGAILVGNGTAGACGYGRPGRVVLPASGTPFQIATARFDPLGNDTPVDGLGLPTDVVLAPGASLSDVQLAELALRLDSHFG